MAEQATAQPANFDWRRPVPCPPGMETENAANRVEVARFVFEGLCPTPLKVIEVSGNSNKGKYKCSWIVKYAVKNVREFSKAELIEQLNVGRPPYTKIIYQRRCNERLNWVVEYGMFECNC